MKLMVLSALALAPAVAWGQSQKDMIRELQRDVAALNEQVKAMQQSIQQNQTELKLSIQQAIDLANRANTSIAVLQSNIENILGKQASAVGQTAAGVGAKVDQLTEEFRSVREAITDMNARLSKLDAKVTDLANAARTIQNPPPAPGSTGGPSGASGGPPPGASAEATYQAAYRDMTGGNLDLALQEFSDYLKWFPQTDYAPNAQFYIGDIYYRKADLNNAIAAFDAVLERYSENPKSLDARYMKGLALVQAGKPTAAAKEFRQIVEKYPGTEQAAKAKAQLRSLGYSASTPSSSTRRRK
ncbi:MAG TPA: tetratricopeptide repeat protein [Bryobacteraceae bacterium]|nr:tetratricopeptide repeat protein [Bryobacteraceae bacterium]